MLEENKRLLLAGYEEYSNDNLSNTVSLLEHIHQNMTYLSTAADF